MTKARDIANAGTALSSVDATELGYVNGVTSAIQTQLDAKTAKSTLTTTGDMYYASSANTPARLGIGSTGNVLTVSGGVPTWATPASGGITLLSTTTLSGSSTTVSSISGDYTNLMVIVRGINLSNNTNLAISTNITNVSYIGTPNGTYGKSQTSIAGIDDGFVGWSSGNTSNVLTMLVYGYSNTSGNKSFHIHGGYYNSDQKAINIFGAWNSSSAINSFTIAPNSGTFDGGSILVYGVK